MDIPKLEVSIQIGRKSDAALNCPECGRTCPGYDQAQPRRWRHLDSMQFQTFLEANVPRCQCPEHGVKVVDVPWAANRDRFTLLFAAFAIEVVRACRSVEQAARLLGLDWKAVHRLQARAVAYGLSVRDLSGLKVVGMDEKMVRCKVGFASVLCDVESGTVIEMAPGRRQEDAEKCWAEVPQAVREGVECGVTDMAASYKAAVRAMAPNADVVIDKFHVSARVNKAVDQTRREEQNAAEDGVGKALKGSRYLWLRDPNKMKASQWRRFEEVYAVAKRTSRAWALKEALADMWNCTDVVSAAAYFQKWLTRVMRSKIEPMKVAARGLKLHLPEILAYFQHRVTNAASEGLNSLITSLQLAARGYRNFFNLRNAVLFHHGGLTLCPVTYPFK